MSDGAFMVQNCATCPDNKCPDNKEPCASCGKGGPPIAVRTPKPSDKEKSMTSDEDKCNMCKFRSTTPAWESPLTPEDLGGARRFIVERTINFQWRAEAILQDRVKGITSNDPLEALAGLIETLKGVGDE